MKLVLAVVITISVLAPARAFAQSPAPPPQRDVLSELLVEVRDEQELELALAFGASIIGVNNRNLKTFEVDVQTSHRLAKLIPDDKIFVVESGIRNRADIDELLQSGADAFLIGETLITSADPRATLRGLL